jgi:hypothetical protein
MFLFCQRARVKLTRWKSLWQARGETTRDNLREIFQKCKVELTCPAANFNNRTASSINAGFGWHNSANITTHQPSGETFIMKLAKIACAGLLAALTFGAYSADAQGPSIVGTTTDYMPLTFALTLNQQQPDHYDSKTGKYTESFKTVKLTNKDILNFFAPVYGRPWPKGARVEYDFTDDAYAAQVVITDDTGTNILIYCDERDFIYLDFEPYYYDGVSSGSSVGKSKGLEEFKNYDRGYFAMYQDGMSSAISTKAESYAPVAQYVDISGYGLTMSRYLSYSTNPRGGQVFGSESLVFRPVCTGYFDTLSTPVSTIAKSNRSGRALITGEIIGGQRWSESAK